MMTLLWLALVLLASPAVSPEEPPALVVPDFSSVPVVSILAVDDGDVITVRQGGLRVQVRLAWLRMSDDPQARQRARAFLQNLLAGEKVWLVHAGLGPNAKDARWYVYRWPDKLLINLEILRQGYADMAAEPNGSIAIAKGLRYWRDLARRQGKGIWSPAPASRPATSQPGEAGAAADPHVPVAADGKTADGGDTVSPAGSAIVYVSASGKKYHRANCRSLRKGGTAMALDEARKSRDPCRQCNPPQ